VTYKQGGPPWPCAVPDDLWRIAHLYGFALTQEEVETFSVFLEGLLPSYEWLDTLPEPALPAKYPRDAGYRPAPEENPLGAWAWRCSIKGAPAGPLAGKRVAVKDNVSVQGLPLLNGSALMDGYLHTVDATIVTRMLDAGAELVGKTVCEDLCFSGGSHTSYPWPVRNPHDPERMAGGSSSGSAAVVAAGEADIAIGGDQGVSIRIPASWCGVYGLKPTYGLVPYTRIFPIELTLDHTGPLARTVTDVALCLEVIAGRDGLDPRQDQTPESLPRYSQELGAGARGLRIGVVPDGFGWQGLSEPDVDEAVREAAGRFESLGAEVREVSVPLHRQGVHFWNGVGVEGTWAIMVRGEGMGHGWLGYHDTALVEFYGRSRRVRAQDFSPTVKMVTILGHYLGERYHGRYYARAQNLRRKRQQFEAWAQSRGYRTAAETLARDWERMVTLYRYPREHWVHIRTVNVVESPLAALRLRTDAAKRFKRSDRATAVIWKMLMVAERRFRRLNAPHLLAKVYAGVRYVHRVEATQEVSA
jgi:amidase